MVNILKNACLSGAGNNTGNAGKNRFFSYLLHTICGIVFLFFTVVIISAFFSVSLTELLTQLCQQTVFSAAWISLQTSFLVVLINLLFGLPVAYVLATKSFRGKMLVDTLIDIPIVFPPLVSGLALLMVFGKDGILGQWLQTVGIEVLFTRKGIVLAQLFVASPFFIKAARESIATVPPNLIAAASTLRASRFYTFTRVILPLCRNGIIAGMVMCWTRALGEFGATAMVAGCIPGQTETLTVSIYSNSMSGNLTAAMTVACLMAAFSFTSLLMLKYLVGKNVPVIK